MPNLCGLLFVFTSFQVKWLNLFVWWTNTLHPLETISVFKIITTHIMLKRNGNVGERFSQLLGPCWHPYISDQLKILECSVSAEVYERIEEYTTFQEALTVLDFMFQRKMKLTPSLWILKFPHYYQKGSLQKVTLWCAQVFISKN